MTVGTTKPNVKNSAAIQEKLKALVIKKIKKDDVNEEKILSAHLVKGRAAIAIVNMFPCPLNKCAK